MLLDCMYVIVHNDQMEKLHDGLGELHIIDAFPPVQYIVYHLSGV